MKNRKLHRRGGRIAAAEEYRAAASYLYGMSDANSAGERRALRTALVKANRALMLDPQNYATLVLLGRIMSDFDDPEAVARALEFYDRAIRLCPENPDAYGSKSDALLFQIDPPDEAEAERLARKAMQLSIRAREEREFLELNYTRLIGGLETRKEFNGVRWTIREALKRCPTELRRELAANALRRVKAEESKV